MTPFLAWRSRRSGNWSLLHRNAASTAEIGHGEVGTAPVDCWAASGGGSGAENRLAWAYSGRSNGGCRAGLPPNPLMQTTNAGGGGRHSHADTPAATMDHRFVTGRLQLISISLGRTEEEDTWRPVVIADLHTGLGSASEDQRWKAARQLGEFVERAPEAVWGLVATWGCSGITKTPERRWPAACWSTSWGDADFASVFPRVRRTRGLADPRIRRHVVAGAGGSARSDQPGNAARFESLKGKAPRPRCRPNPRMQPTGQDRRGAPPRREGASSAQRNVSWCGRQHDSLQLMRMPLGVHAKPSPLPRDRCGEEL